MQLTVSGEIEKTKEEIIHFHERISNTQGADNTETHDHILRLKTYLINLIIFNNLPNIDRFSDHILIDLPEENHRSDSNE